MSSRVCSLFVALVLGACSSCGAVAPDERRPPAGEPSRPAEPPTPSPQEPPVEPAASGFDTSGWQALLNDYVTDDGGFRYAALRSDEAAMARLDAVVDAVATAEVGGWSRDARLAFYLNAYNVLTVSAVLAHWPLESVMAVEGFFDAETHRVAGLERTLNALENDVIRDRDAFGEPRIHFAVNCASVGCPWLSAEAFRASNLERQLSALSEAFVRRTSRFEGGALHVSQIFSWFADDFAPDGVRAFLVARLEGELAERARDASVEIRFDEYDWALNRRP